MYYFTDNIEPIRSFIGSTLKSRRLYTLLELWRVAELSFDFDGDTIGFNDYNTLTIYVKVPDLEYQRIVADQLSELENSIEQIAEDAIRAYSNIDAVKVRIIPSLDADKSWRGEIERPNLTTAEQESRIWRPGRFRLFLSHSSQDKKVCSQIKMSLERINVDVFVAHEDINPTELWMNEISNALASCHAMVFLATVSSNNSAWCQQEIGWALGRGIYLIPVKYACDPQGFAGSLQALPYNEASHNEFCRSLINVLVREERTQSAMHEPLIQYLLKSNKVKSLKIGVSMARHLKGMRVEDANRLLPVLAKDAVNKSPDLKMDLEELLKELGAQTDVGGQVFESDYDPFADE